MAVRLLIACILSLSFGAAKAKAVPVSKRLPDPETIRRFREHPDFQYDEAFEKSWLDKFLEWLQKLFNVNKAASSFHLPDWVIYTIVGAIILFAVYILLRSEIHGLFSRDRSVSAYDVGEGEHIHAVNFNERIAAAEREGNYRLALRLHFLKSLQILSLSGLIQWKPHKTNAEYLRELKMPALHAPFSESIRLYHNYWYGLFPLGKELYAESVSTFQKFEAQLQKEVPA